MTQLPQLRRQGDVDVFHCLYEAENDLYGEVQPEYDRISAHALTAIALLLARRDEELWFDYQSWAEAHP